MTTIGFWNIKTLNDKDDINSNMNSRFLQIEREFQRYKLNILGLSEVRWNGAGEFRSPTKNSILLYSGKDIGRNREAGVGILLSLEARKCVIDWKPISDRLMWVRFRSKVRNISIIQCYAPTESATDDEKDNFYSQLNAVYDSLPRGDIFLTMGDLNAKVGSDNQAIEHVMGKHGIGLRNDNGERFIDFCNSRRLVIGGTLFEHKTCHKITWVSTDRNSTSNQIDHIAISRRFRKCLLDVRSKRGADCGYAKDHSLVIAKLRLCTAAIQAARARTRPPKLDLARLKTGAIKENFRDQMANEFCLNSNNNPVLSVDNQWITVRDKIKNIANNIIGPIPKGRTPWMSEDTWSKIEERNEAKKAIIHDNPETTTKYKILKKEVQRLVRKDKRKCINELADEAELAANNNDCGTLYKISKKLVDKGHHTEHPVRDVNGVLLVSDDEQLQRWREHFSTVLNNIFSENSQPNVSYAQITNARITIDPPSINEIVTAIRQLPTGKAAGIDGIPVELFKVDPTLTAQIIRPIIHTAWEQEEFPSEWKEGIIIKLPKKGNLKECHNWRGICVLPAIAKIIAKIILLRIKDHLESTIGEFQAGFRSGFSCADHINTLRIIIEQSAEFKSNIHLLFIDYEKAFDSVNRNRIWSALSNRGIPPKIIAMIRASYSNANCYVLHKGRLSEPFAVQSGVRQGCILSPILFLIVMGDVLSAALQNDSRCSGIRWKLNGSHLSHLAYADDICLLSNNINNVLYMAESISQASTSAGLRINIPKTKLLSSCSSIPTNDLCYEQVNNFCYLGSNVSVDGGSDLDVENRITKARAAFGLLAPLWQNNNISLRTKIRIFNSNVKAVLLYACNTWKVTVQLTNRLQIFVNRCLRRILRIFWPRTISNEELLRRTNQVEIAIEIRRRKWNWIGHTLRRDDNNIAKHALRWNPFDSVNRGVGRPRITWRRSTEDEMRSLNVSWGQLRTLAQNRVRWKSAVVDALCSNRS